MNNKKIILLRGSSGSGKDTVSKLFSGNVSICSADDYFVSNGEYNFNSDHLGIAHAQCKQKFLSAIQDPDIDTIIINNTNTKEKDFNFYVAEAEKRGIMLFSLVVEKRHNGVNSHGVSDHVIDRHVENIKNSLKLQ